MRGRRAVFRCTVEPAKRLRLLTVDCFGSQLDDDETMIGTQVKSETAAVVSRLQELLRPQSFEESVVGNSTLLSSEVFAIW